MIEIQDVQARTLRIPLERPIRTSNLLIEAREFVLVEVTARDGTTGHGFGFTRGGLIAETVERNLKPLLVGLDARQTEHLWERMYSASRYLGRNGIVMRAISAIDIALWDLKGKSANLPLWSMIGGYRESVPAFAAGGYYGPATDPADVESEFRAYRDAGFRGAKINAGGLPFDEDLERIVAARQGLGDDLALAVDFNGALDSARRALAWAHALEPLGVSFMEEPFLMDNHSAIRSLGDRSPVRVAMGEDASGRWAFAELVRTGAVDILRHDATLVGGISEWLKVAGLGLANHLELFPHWFPEVHIHLSAAFPSCLGVELITAESGIMNLHTLISRPIVQEDGHAAVPLGPGLGIDWNWDAVEEATT